MGKKWKSLFRHNYKQIMRFIYNFKFKKEIMVCTCAINISITEKMLMVCTCRYIFLSSRKLLLVGPQHASYKVLSRI